MKYRPLGATGLSVSRLGYGASPLGGAFGPVEETEANRCVRTALDLGVNLLDVSPFYGKTTAEIALGKALRGVPRDSYYLSTKVGRYGDREFDFSPERVTRSVDESLARLGVESVDILLCHDIEFVPLPQIWEETLPALRQVVAAGKARFLGVSGLPLTIFPDVLAHTELDVVLSYCHHTLSDTSLDILLPFLNEKNIGVINASPLGMGLLNGDISRVPSWHPAPPELRAACARAGEWCRSQGADLAELALAFSVSRSDIASTLVGTANAEEMRRNVKAALSVPDPYLLAGVREILQPVRDLSWKSGLAANGGTK